MLHWKAVRIDRISQAWSNLVTRFVWKPKFRARTKVLKKQAAVGFLQAKGSGDVQMVLGVFKSLLANLKRNQRKADQTEEQANLRFNNLMRTKKVTLGVILVSFKCSRK